MEIIKIVIVAIVSIVLIIVLSTYNKEQSFMLRIATCILILLLTLSKLEIFKTIFDEINNISAENNVYLEIIFKIIGIAYLVEIASEISKDAGENAISSNLLLAGKVLILYIASPIILTFISLMSEIIK